MTKKTGWELLQLGQLRQALKSLKDEFHRDPFIGTRNSVGICYLCLGDAQAARKIFDEALTEAERDSGSHALAGIARWILKEYEDAVRVWSDGLDCDYRDAAGGMELPLLLFYASARDPEVFPTSRAKKLIEEALKSSWATNWPGPLGMFVLKKIDEKKARQEAEFDVPKELARCQLSQVEFYAGILAYLRDNQEEFMDRMRRCAKTRWCEMENEWYLARYEASTFKE